jgi:ATP-binding cassette subfamily C protein
VTAAAALDRILNAPLPGMPAMPAVDRALALIALPTRGLVAITGPSGSGKSTLLRRLTGVDPGLVPAAAGRRFTWVAIDGFVASGTVADAIAWGMDEADVETIRLAAARVGLVDDDMLPGGIAAKVERGGANLSGGQRVRIALARALLSDHIVIADEPTAKLDPATASLIRVLLHAMAQTRLVLVATHDRNLMAAADRCLDLAALNPLEVAA